MSNLFHVIQDAFVIVRSKGVYTQRKVYRRLGRLYAQHGSGYVTIGDAGTSGPDQTIEGYEGFSPIKGKLDWWYWTEEAAKQSRKT